MCQLDWSPPTFLPRLNMPNKLSTCSCQVIGDDNLKALKQRLESAAPLKQLPAGTRQVSAGAWLTLPPGVGRSGTHGGQVGRWGDALSIPENGLQEITARSFEDARLLWVTQIMSRNGVGATGYSVKDDVSVGEATDLL